MQKVQSQTRHQRRYSRTRNRILDAARSVFSEKGISGISVDEITARADVGRGSFYYHFGSMDKLIRVIVREILNELILQIKASCAGKKNLEDMLNALIVGHIRFFDNRWQDFVLYYQGRAELTLEQSYEGIETPFLEYIQSIERLVDSVLSQPMPEARLRRLACAVAGFISGYYSFASIAPVGEDVDLEMTPMRHAFVASLTRFAQEPSTDKDCFKV